MYIGDVGKRGLHHLVYEVVDNSIDAGADNVWIIFAEETYINKESFYLITVDDGSGIGSSIQWVGALNGADTGPGGIPIIPPTVDDY
ncbi:MAG: hypothetical protein COB86_07405, partial [Dehalococcoidia bacterium]